MPPPWQFRWWCSMCRFECSHITVWLDISLNQCILSKLVWMLWAVHSLIYIEIGNPNNLDKTINPIQLLNIPCVPSHSPRPHSLTKSAVFLLLCQCQWYEIITFTHYSTLNSLFLNMFKWDNTITSNFNITSLVQCLDLNACDKVNT